MGVAYRCRIQCQLPQYQRTPTTLVRLPEPPPFPRRLLRFLLERPDSDDRNKAAALLCSDTIRRRRHGIATYSRPDSTSEKSINPFAFFTCTNTLGNSLAFADQTVDGSGDAGEFAVPPGVGGLAGEAIHSLSLGNVYSFSGLLAKSQDPALREIAIIGAGGVTSPEAVSRMHRAGAKVVGCATLLGKLGVAAFEHISRKT
jgi:hypothetical protein